MTNINTFQGDVGIGTTSPDYKLHVEDLTNPRIMLENTDTALALNQDIGSIIFKQNDSTSTGTGIIGKIRMSSVIAPPAGTFYGESANMIFSVGNYANNNANTDALTIRGNGNVGIGTNAPGEKLHVHENISTSGHQIVARIGGDTSSFNTLVFGSSVGRPHVGGHIGDFSNWADLSLQNDTMVLRQGTGVGIGTTIPKDDLHIFEASNGQTTGLFIEKQTGASGTAQITFGVAAGNEGSTGKAKAGIFFERTAGNGRGELHFCVDSSSDNNGVALSDVRMVITNAGDVGVGTDAPGAKLHVNGNVDNVGISIQNNARKYTVGVRGDTSDVFSIVDDTAGAFRAVIASDGKVGIGSSAPTQVLDVAGHIGCTGLVTGGVLIRSAANLNISAGTFIKVADYASLVVGGNNYLVTVAWNSYVTGGSQVLWYGAASWYSSTNGGAQRIYAPWNSNLAPAASQVYHFRTISAFSFVESAVTPTAGNYQAHGIQMTNTQSTGTANSVSAKARLIGVWT